VAVRNRFFIIRNPRAGRYGRYIFDTTLEALRASGADVESVSTEGRRDGALQAREAVQSAAFDAIVAAGVERTIREVAAELVGSAMPLGVIPTGTGNVFARELGYSFAPFALARTLQAGPVERISLGEVDGQPFLSLVGVGFDAAAVRHFEKVTPHFLGRASFAYPVLRALMGRPCKPLTVETESGRYRAHWVIISRVKRYAGDLLLTPEAGLVKPGMYVIRFQGAGRMNRLRHLSALVTGLLPRDPRVSIEAAQHVTITGDPKSPVQVDGEFTGALPLEIGLHPERLSVIMPAQAN